MDRHGSRARHRRAAIERTALVIVLTLGVLATLAISASAKAVRTEVPTRTVVVQSGDTLWGLAKANPLPGKRTAETVREIQTLNGLDGAEVAAGQAVRVPAVR